MREKTRIGLLGGVFDPVHHLHLQLARCAREQAGLDEIVFIPAGHSPLKTYRPYSDAAQRLAMLALAIKGESNYRIDTCELDRQGPSYTIDTVLSLRNPNRACRSDEADIQGGDTNSKAYFWILGADQFVQLDKWHRVGDLVREVTFLVFGRAGYKLEVPAIKGLHHMFIEMDVSRLSSTRIREHLKKGQSINAMVPETVQNYIEKNRLYA